MPHSDIRLAPLEILLSTQLSSYYHIRILHVFSCPAYVIDTNLQYVKKLPKRSPRSHCGQYMGVSPSHFSTINPILNLDTLFVIPQYHVIYDDKFTFIPNDTSYGLFYNNPFNAYSWDSLVHSGLECYINQEDFYPSYQHHRMPELHVDWLTPDESHHPLPSVTVSKGEQPSAK